MTIDFSPIRDSREFRLLVTGDSISAVGSAITAVAVPIQVYALTRSTIAVGAIGAAELGAAVLVAPLGGALADGVDRRRLLLAVNGALAATSVLLALNARVDTPALWAIYSLAALAAALQAVAIPARRSAVPLLVRPHLLVAAQPIEFLAYSIAGVAAPLIAGALIAGRPGMAGAYAADALSFAATLVTLSRMRAIAPSRGDVSDVSRMRRRSVREGLRFVRATPVIRGVFLADLCATVFGMPTALFPALGATLQTGPLGVAALYAALDAGALVATLSSGWTSSVLREGRVICLAIGAWGIAIALAAAMPWLAAVVVLLVMAGAPDTVIGIFRVAIVLRATPDHLRGRLSGIEWAQVNAGPALGDLEAGVVARLTSVRVSMASGGLLCVGGVIALALALPGFWSYRAPDPAASPTALHTA
jgi:MFS family permease